MKFCLPAFRPRALASAATELQATSHALAASADQTNAQSMAVAGAALATIVWGWAMHRFTDAAYPGWDAGVAILSVVAQILMSRRLLENWLLWIAVDVLAIGLYAAKGLQLTALLYVIFLALSLWGLLDWRASERRLAVA